jgi:hypothetical protein
MGHENKTYVIINMSDLGSVDFSEVMETSSSTVRPNNDNTLTFVKYEGSEPLSVQGITKVTVDGREYHTHSQIKTILSTTGTTGWTTISDI